MSILEEIKYTFKQGSILNRLIYINLGVFLLVRIAYLFFFLAGKEFYLLSWLALPSNLHELSYKPWTLLTYMFLHFSFIHILFNLWVLYWFGKMFLSVFDSEKLLGLYLAGGLAGAAFYVAGFNLFPVFEQSREVSELLGASASIIAIVIAVAVYEPRREVNLVLLGPVQLRYIAIFLVLSYIIGISATNAGGNLAHLGGVVLGYFFIVFLRKGKDIVSWLAVLPGKIAALFKPRSKIRVTHKQPPRDDYEYNRQKAQSQSEINLILDKISKSGYDSLSKTEKEILFKMGKK